MLGADIRDSATTEMNQDKIGNDRRKTLERDAWASSFILSGSKSTN